MTDKIAVIGPAKSSAADFDEILTELKNLNDRGELVTLAVCGKITGGRFFSNFAYPAGEWDGALAATCILKDRLVQQ